MTQADLMAKANLSKTTVSRICRNKNDKGGSYKPTRRMVITICVALGLNKAEKDNLMKIAFPEEELWDLIIENKLDIFESNELLFEKNLPLLGSLD